VLKGEIKALATKILGRNKKYLLQDFQSGCSLSRQNVGMVEPGTDVMILKIFLPKKLEKN
jgi:hypothetical protein